jgi:hypothetical protein
MDPSAADVSPLQELITEWRAKFRGSWANFGGYFALRRKILSDTNTLSPEQAGARTIPPLKFAMQGLAIIAGIGSAIGLGQTLIFRDSHPAVSSDIELYDSKERIANISRNLDFFDIHKDPPSTNQTVDIVAHQILKMQPNGLRLEELQVALNDQKAKEKGVLTPYDELLQAQSQILRKVAELRRQRVHTHHITEPRGLLPEVVNEHSAYIMSQLRTFQDLDSLNKAGGINAVARQIENAPELANDMTGFLENDANTFADELNKQRIAAKEDAPARILVLERAIELYKQPHMTPEERQQRVQEISKGISPVAQALAFVFASYLFAWFLRVGQRQPKTTLALARMAYLYLFTGSMLWWNATIPVAMVLLAILWRSGIGVWWALALTTASISFYIVWAIRILYVVSEKLRSFFQMENSRRFYNLYRGARKIRLDLIVANFIAAFVVHGFGFAVALAYVKVVEHLG